VKSNVRNVAQVRTGRVGLQAPVAKLPVARRETTRHPEARDLRGQGCSPRRARQGGAPQNQEDRRVLDTVSSAKAAARETMGYDENLWMISWMGLQVLRTSCVAANGRRCADVAAPQPAPAAARDPVPSRRPSSSQQLLPAAQIVSSLGESTLCRRCARTHSRPP
jgi:hypothetical protein